jgi:hypothetical protein
MVAHTIVRRRGSPKELISAKQKQISLCLFNVEGKAEAIPVALLRQVNQR